LEHGVKAPDLLFESLQGLKKKGLSDYTDAMATTWHRWDCEHPPCAFSGFRHAIIWPDSLIHIWYFLL